MRKWKSNLPRGFLEVFGFVFCIFVAALLCLFFVKIGLFFINVFQEIIKRLPELTQIGWL
jgi:hypothetical protein